MNHPDEDQKDAEAADAEWTGAASEVANCVGVCDDVVHVLQEAQTRSRSARVRVPTAKAGVLLICELIFHQAVLAEGEAISLLDDVPDQVCELFLSSVSSCVAGRQ